MTSLIMKDHGYYCYMCKCIVLFRSESRISYKIKQETCEKYNYIILGPWIESLVSQSLGTVDEYKA